MTKRASPKNIYIVGAQCTGKTSLVDALVRSLDQNLSNTPAPTVIQEVAKSVLRRHGFTANDIVSDSGRCLKLQFLILQAQFDKERDALQTPSGSSRTVPGLIQSSTGTPGVTPTLMRLVA